MVRPIVEYGAELWHGEISKSWSKKLERLQRSLCSAVLKLQGNVATVGMHAELGLLSLADRRVCLKLGYYQRLCDASEDRLLSLIFRRRHAEVERGAAPHSGLQSMRVAMADAGFAKEWRARDCGAGDWVSEVKLAVTERAALVQREEMAQRSTLAEYVRLGLRPLTKNALHLDDAYGSPGPPSPDAKRGSSVRLASRESAVCSLQARCGGCAALPALLSRPGSLPQSAGSWR